MIRTSIIQKNPEILINQENSTVATLLDDFCLLVNIDFSSPKCSGFTNCLAQLYCKDIKLYAFKIH